MEYGQQWVHVAAPLMGSECGWKNIKKLLICQEHPSLFGNKSKINTLIDD